jgi:hypothetical protein
MENYSTPAGTSSFIWYLGKVRMNIPPKNTFPTVLRAKKSNELKNNGNYKLRTMPEDKLPQPKRKESKPIDPTS